MSSDTENNLVVVPFPARGPQRPVANDNHKPDKKRKFRLWKFLLKATGWLVAAIVSIALLIVCNVIFTILLIMRKIVLGILSLILTGSFLVITIGPFLPNRHVTDTPFLMGMAVFTGSSLLIYLYDRLLIFMNPDKNSILILD